MKKTAVLFLLTLILFSCLSVESRPLVTLGVEDFRVVRTGDASKGIAISVESIRSVLESLGFTRPQSIALAPRVAGALRGSDTASVEYQGKMVAFIYAASGGLAIITFEGGEQKTRSFKLKTE